MTRDEAYQLVTEWTKSPHLVKHMCAVEVQMRALARHFGEDEELWGLAGLLHDADYEMHKEEPLKHPSTILSELRRRQVDERIISAIHAHAWGWQPEAPMPSTPMEWSLYCSDELSGFIFACALVRPEKALSAVTLESMQKKWKEKSFAAGVNRAHAELSEERLGIPLSDFMTLCLEALQQAEKDGK